MAPDVVGQHCQDPGVLLLVGFQNGAHLVSDGRFLTSGQANPEMPRQDGWLSRRNNITMGPRALAPRPRSHEFQLFKAKCSLGT